MSLMWHPYFTFGKRVSVTLPFSEASVADESMNQRF